MELRVSDNITVINSVGSNPVATSVYDMGYRCTEVNHPASSSFITNLDGEVVQHIEYIPFGEVFFAKAKRQADNIEERNNVWNTPYLFNAKEFDEETGMYYYGARYYEPRLSLWISTDPMESKYPSISSYCYTFNNPINLIVQTGEEPTEEEAARMSAYVYGDIQVKLTGNWKVSERDIKDFNPVDSENGSGFKSMLLERTINGKKEYTYALAGTDKSSWADWKNNAELLVGLSEQYQMALQIASALISELNGSELTFVGHSLGGGMAAACAYSVCTEGIVGRALTFNPAGVSPLTIMPNRTANIDTYITYRDELNMFQSNLSFLPSPNGKIHYRLGDATWLGHSIENFYEPSVYKRAFDTVKDKTIKFLRGIENALTPKWPF